MFAATINPKSVKKEDPKNVPNATTNKLLECAVNAIIIPTTVEIMPMEITFEKIYSPFLTGDTAMEFNTLSLFSSKTIAPIKNNPMAAGSEKIIIAAAFSRHAGGKRKIKDM